MNYVAPSIVGYIGFDLTVKCLSSITSSATNICSLLNFISVHSSHADTIFEIKKLDLDTDIEGTDILLKELQPRLDETTHTQSLAFNVKKLHHSIYDIELKLLDIHDKLAYNKSLIIAPGFRSFKIENEVETLKVLKNIFKERRATLFEVIKINPYLRPYNPKNDLVENCMDESMIFI
jgi:hypothetical protein